VRPTANVGTGGGVLKTLRTHRWLFFALGIVVLAVIVAAVAHASQGSEQPATVTRGRNRRWLGVAAFGVALLAGALVAGAYAYDASQSHVISRGVRVGYVAVGGLTPAEARRKLTRVYRKLGQPVIVRSGSQRFRLAPRHAGLVVHLDEAVSRALARSRRGWFLARTFRDITGLDARRDVTLRVTFSRIAVSGFAARVERAVERPPRAAKVIPRAGGLFVASARHGLEVDRARLRRAIERALRDAAVARHIRVPARRISPKVTVADLSHRVPAYITVDRSRFQLRLYERLKLARMYRVSVGQIGYETPSGLYRIQNKAVNPTWSVPHSAWTGSLAGAVIPPGPSNPLKARWLGIYGGAGIHGTDQAWSLGSPASHGCIRMAIPDVIDLYDRVEVGTPIYIG
jgi:lipoprotein-anchoring transpeptidase ErfK/SrfK